MTYYNYDYIVNQTWKGKEGQVCFKGWALYRMFSTIQGAIDDVAKRELKDVHINVEPGAYHEQIVWGSGAIHLEEGKPDAKTQ